MTIETIARAEIVKAFEGLDVMVSSNRNARYRVRVVQELSDQRFPRSVNVAGESRAARFGGSGSVNFSFLASGAMGASDDADRADTIIDAIGRGIGRTPAVHEFAHQLLPSKAIDENGDSRSFESNSGGGESSNTLATCIGPAPHGRGSRSAWDGDDPCIDDVQREAIARTGRARN